jgi:hypothetical protein
MHYKRECQETDAVATRDREQQEFCAKKQESDGGGGKQKQIKGGASFTPIVRYNAMGQKIYECPRCHSVSGTAVVQNPNNLYLFTHSYLCLNIGKIPIEDLKEAEHP